MSDSTACQRIFVYGTLKTRQIRQSNWPCPPSSIELAWTLGRLFDTGPFPALIHGKDAVAGQLWTLEKQDISRTLEVLDMIEGTNQPGERNEYDRETQQVHLPSGESFPAFIYFFARHDLLDRFEYIEPHVKSQGLSVAIWPRGSQWIV